MTTPGQDLIESAREALAIAEGKVVPGWIWKKTTTTAPGNAELRSARAPLPVRAYSVMVNGR